MKELNLVILGSTGSIGKMTLEVIDRIGGYRVLGLSTNRNVDVLIQQIKKYKPKFIAISDENEYKIFCENQQDVIRKYDLEVFRGEKGLCELVDIENIDFVMAAVVGAVGLKPIYNALKKGCRVAVANKEPIVIAGEILMKEAKKHGNAIFPVDSEHSAIYQCLLGENTAEVNKLILTASGGPFYRYETKALESVTVDDALKHPRWKMGKKITIDSATLMNKGFEVIEAHHLFNMSIDKIDVIIHPESIIHSMVEFVDGSVKAHLGKTDMRIPIQFAFTYPKRAEIQNMSLDFAHLKSLNFEAVDYSKFPCLKLAFDCVQAGDGYPVVLNAANEILVEKFLAKDIEFMDIPNRLIKVLDKYKPVKVETLDDILELDKNIRNLNF